MSTFSLSAFDATLTARLPVAFNGRLCVAFSGGLDSTVLLHAMNELRSVHADWQVRAIHINHQLHTSSAEWATHCERVADALGIKLIVERVDIARDHPQGLEAAARSARYAVFRGVLQNGEVLLTAHHADDQAETVLLALMRGSGVQGLAAMPAVKEFGRGWHLRPMLPFARTNIEEWSRARSIEAIQDPSNALLRHDRNYLRHAVLPALKNRWPTMADSVSRSATHLGEALDLLEEQAVVDLRTCGVDRCVRIEMLRALTPARRRNVLRFWLRLRGLPLPSTRKLVGLEHDLLNTDLDRIPCVTWQGAELHWHRGLLYASPPLVTLEHADKFEQDWDRRESLTLPVGLGRLLTMATFGPGLSAARLPAQLTLRFRRGGEKILLPRRRHRHALRNLLQEQNVLPWYRDRLPLLFVEKQLVAIADLAWSDEFSALPGEPAIQVMWEDAPDWKAPGLESSKAAMNN